MAGTLNLPLLTFCRDLKQNNSFTLAMFGHTGYRWHALPKERGFLMDHAFRQQSETGEHGKGKDSDENTEQKQGRS